jgi:hypothetical protein
VVDPWVKAQFHTDSDIRIYGAVEINTKEYYSGELHMMMIKDEKE